MERPAKCQTSAADYGLIVVSLGVVTGGRLEYERRMLGQRATPMKLV